MFHLFHRVHGFHLQSVCSPVAEDILIVQVDTRGARSFLTETTPLLAPNVYGCAEVLSLPSLIVQGAFGFHESSFPNVMKYVVCISKELYTNVVRQVPVVNGESSSVVMSGSRSSGHSQKETSSLVDGKRFNCADVLFQPYFVGPDVMKCDVHIRKELSTERGLHKARRAEGASCARLICAERSMSSVSLWIAKARVDR